MSEPVHEAPAPLLSGGRRVGVLRVSCTPDTKDAVPPLIVPALPDGDSTRSEQFQLLEGSEYHYRIETGLDGPVTSNRPELFRRDNVAGRSGRLKTGLYTGTLSTTFTVGETVLAPVDFEVRSRKLDYKTHYRWMMEDVARVACELVLSEFGPTTQRLEHDGFGDALTEYQRFAFLDHLLRGGSLEAAVSRIVSVPYVAWKQDEQLVTPGMSMRLSGEVARSLSIPGPRVMVPSVLQNVLPSTLPRVIRRARHETTLDNSENRFVKFTLLRWRGVASDLGLSMKARRATGINGSHSLERGVRESQVLVDRLDELLAHPFFDEVGQLRRFPGASQALQRKPGYREIFRIHQLFDVATRLRWTGGEEVFAGGKRDVATLYEYWVYFQLLAALERLGIGRVDKRSLIGLTNDGVSLELRCGSESSLRGYLVWNGRPIDVALFFNRRFQGGAGSWTRTMRPDCSVTFRPASPYEGSDVTLHFDAKYRIANIVEAFGSAEDVIGAGDPQEDKPSVRRAKSDDLVKMHAYKDAILTSAGAYILYPGDEKLEFREFHELLPGLGAFPLHPSGGGAAQGSDSLDRFLREVLTHLSRQGSTHERLRYWERRVLGEGDSAKSPPFSEFIHRPPADERALIVRIPRRASELASKSGRLQLSPSAPKLVAEASPGVVIAIAGKSDHAYALFKVLKPAKSQGFRKAGWSLRVRGVRWPNFLRGADLNALLKSRRVAELVISYGSLPGIPNELP